MKEKNIWFVLVGLFICLLFGGTVFAGEQEHSLQFFYENVCASCNEDEKFYDLFKRCVTPEEKTALRYEIRTYNTFLDADREVYEKTLKEAGKKHEDVSLPVLVIDGQWLSGYDKIEAELHNVLFEGKVVEESGKAKTEEEEKAVSFEEALAIDAADEEKAALLFSTYACSDCEAVKEYLAELGENTDFVLKECNIAQGDYVNLFKNLLTLYGKDAETGKVPAVFVGNMVLIGKEEIQRELESLLEKEESRYGVLKDKIAGIQEEERKEAFSLAAIFGAGLLAGFNPCSISMLLMLFSILLTSRASVMKNGALYLGAKYLTYLGIGIAICFAASMVDQEFLGRFGRWIDGFMALLFLGAAVLNFLDFRSVRRADYGKVRMQLPQKLRRFNHHLLKKAEHMEGAILGVLVFGLGAAISLGEFFCTGQIYMASILYLLRTARDQFLPLLGTLLVYVTAMSIPAVVILVIIHKTKGTSRVSDFMLKHMGAVKLLNSLLFFGYACYFLFF